MPISQENLSGGWSKSMTAKRHEAKVPAPREQPSIDQKIEAELGEKLRDAFSDILNEPVPDRFRVLIEALSKGKDE